MPKKLTDFDPQFKVYDGKRIGFDFKCPGCDDPMCRIFLYVDPPFDEGALRPADESRAWKRTGEPWDTLTLTPSILLRKSKSPEEPNTLVECWHGFITNGQVTP